MTVVHRPVLLGEVIEVLSPVENGTYIDATTGLGGHAAEILKRIGREGRIIGIDRDRAALGKAAERMGDSRFIATQGSFSQLEALAHASGVTHVDGILFDLGVSMMQLKDMGRGFSFHSDQRLDMRMDSGQPFSAWDVVNGYGEEDLVRILREYGEEFRAARIVRAIVRERKKATIDTASALAAIVEGAIGRRGRTHPATRTFQAIRIEVNRELEELRAGLAASLNLLKQGGRLCVISYHSLEDRIVKNYIRERAREGIVRILLKKPAVPGPAERRENPSSRSAKLRGAEKL